MTKIKGTGNTPLKFGLHDMLVYNISGGHKNGKERVKCIVFGA